jgi:hypothetical protein
MRALYVISMVAFSGKTALCLGLGLHLRAEGMAVGYFKPLSIPGHQAEIREFVDPIVEDAGFVRRVFGLTRTANELAPLVMDDGLFGSVLGGRVDGEALWQTVEGSYRAACQEKDMLLIEGGATMRDGVSLGMDAVTTATRLDAPVLIITRCHANSLVVDDIVNAKAQLGERLLGVVLNNVTEQAMETVQQDIVPYFEGLNIPVYGVLPHQPALEAISIGQIVELLQANVLVGEQMMGRLVESIVVGAMSVEGALPSLHDTNNKVFITGSSRTDLQAAALETSTACMILTGEVEPSPAILERAKTASVCVLWVPDFTINVLDKIEGVFGKTPLVQAEKLNRFQALLAQHLDYDRLWQGLGIG